MKGSKAHQELALRLPDTQFVVAIFVNLINILMIPRLARVKDEMGDKEGAEDLREEARET